MRWGKKISQLYAKLWQRFYAVQYKVFAFCGKHAPRITAGALIVAVIVSLPLVPFFQGLLIPLVDAGDGISGFQTLLVTLGGSLVGAAAIAFSLVMFAMQVNIERMPHGLFRRFSLDARLMAAFGTTFLIAITIMSQSLVSSVDWVGMIAFVSLWGTIFVILLFLYAYRRALALISPTKQLGFVWSDVRRDVDIWETRIRRARPLIDEPAPAEQAGGVAPRSDHDLGRIAFFRLYPGWSQPVKQGISHCIAYARRYAEQGDHEVADAALLTIVAINQTYVSVKGKTFFSDNGLIETGLSTDGVINETLEQLRQNVRIGLSRGDERQVERSFAAMAQLCGVYLQIDYASEHASKTHSHLAVHYLCEAVKSAVPHNMPDVLMEGLRLMGGCAQLILCDEGSTYIPQISESIAMVSCVGAASKDQRPVTHAGVEQLANLTLSLLRSNETDVRYALKEVRDDVAFVANIYLQIPDTPLGDIHSQALGRYYSGTTPLALGESLRVVVNAISDAEADSDDAKKLIGHFVQWSEDLYQTEKELLLLAIAKKSHFAFDLIHWITTVTKYLVFLSTAPACDDRNRDAT